VKDVSQRQIRALAEFRHQIRRFLHFSEEAAKSAGIEPQQHQLMLAIKAVEPEPAGLGFLAERLLLRHHSVVGLVDRLEQAGFVKRKRSDADRRSAYVVLTPRGTKMLHKLSAPHRQELKSAIPALIASLVTILHDIDHDTESKH
jgi:DNA-binding MarR family transcriptional regulator